MYDQIFWYYSNFFYMYMYAYILPRFSKLKDKSQLRIFPESRIKIIFLFTCL
jgi:hypothetical protein